MAVSTIFQRMKNAYENPTRPQNNHQPVHGSARGKDNIPKRLSTGCKKIATRGSNQSRYHEKRFCDSKVIAPIGQIQRRKAVSASGAGLTITQPKMAMRTKSIGNSKLFEVFNPSQLRN